MVLIVIRLTEQMVWQKLFYQKLTAKHYLCRNWRKKITKTETSSATFENIFRYLTQSGYVQKSSTAHRTKYVLTNKGVKL
jgi:predicted transcriptional regulator